MIEQHNRRNKVTGAGRRTACDHGMCEYDRIRRPVGSVWRWRVALSAASACRDVALARAAAIRLVVHPPRPRVAAQAVSRSRTASVPQQPPLAFETASVKPNNAGQEERYSYGSMIRR